MGKIWRHRYRRAPIDNTELPSRAPRRFHRRAPSVNTPASPQSQSFSSLVDSGNSKLSNDPQFKRKPPQCRLNQQWHRVKNKQSDWLRSSPANNIPDHAFLQKSLILKQNLVRSFNQALAQIEQWYPDVSPEGDLMDWQLEDEFVIPQNNDIIYSYELPVTPEAGPGGTGNRVVEFRWEASASTREMPASNVEESGIANRSQRTRGSEIVQ